MTETEKAIDLNADLGEGFPWDEPLLERVTSASICCGAHAGDPALIMRTLRAARERGVVVGAHPGYADRPSFGRRELALSSHEVERLVIEQVQRLEKLAALVGLELKFIKPHGALYNQAQFQEPIASGVISATRRLGLPVLGQPATHLESMARREGLRFVPEGFADRRYLPDGRLVPRTDPRAILDDPEEARAQVLRLVDAGIQTLCIHGDDPRAVALADRVRGMLDQAAIVRRSFV
ncbi:MAG TPA: 5-oxoprolinase subunit PxpA [Isosphaeraceae bacterium]|nr:5-oxoprolinase subunit PxpA [Isosphaeraceae bacterium]